MVVIIYPHQLVYHPNSLNIIFSIQSISITRFYSFPLNIIPALSSVSILINSFIIKFYKHHIKNLFNIFTIPSKKFYKYYPNSINSYQFYIGFPSQFSMEKPAWSNISPPRSNHLRRRFRPQPLRQGQATRPGTLRLGLRLVQRHRRSTWS